MQRFAFPGQQSVQAIARRHGFSPDAVVAMMNAIAAGHGRMAQFDHPEFGGCGQWMRGGMTMIGDMFNAPLKTRVRALCEDLAAQAAAPAAADASPATTTVVAAPVRAEPAWGSPGAWWPAGLGFPDASGAQDGMRYAYFAAARRLAVAQGGRITVYDTGEHRIGGVAQQQAGNATLAFTSQHGAVDLTRLAVVPGDNGAGGAGS